MLSFPSRTTALLNLPILLGLASAVAASDGVVEVNQARALAGGINPSDTPGFPILITERGSYVLTSNLDLSALSIRDAFFVVASDVSIDLNGFTILGPVTCSGNPPDEDLVCSGSNSSFSGVDASGSTGTNLTVRNGTVRGFAGSGVRCNKGCRVIDVTVEENAVAGINLASDGMARGCLARRNGGSGITANAGTRGVSIDASISAQNGAEGFFVGDGVVSGSVAKENRATGIFTNSATLVTGSVLHDNNGSGVRLNGGSAFDNVIRNNAGAGIEVAGGAHSPYARNLIKGNGSTVTGTAVEVGVNVCETNTTCP